MIFNSIQFALFFIVTITILFILPGKLRTVWLLIASIFFYGYSNPVNLIYLMVSIITTWGFALLIDSRSMTAEKTGAVKNNRKIKHRKFLFLIGLLFNFGILIVFKYTDFIISIISGITEVFGNQPIDKRFHIEVPIGLSFYIFSATGYLIDVYRGRVSAEKNLAVYALFESFFPNILSGPIERANHLIPQIKNYSEVKMLNYDRIVSGAILMLWGFFLKMVIADRVAVIVDTVYGKYYFYGSTELLLASISYTLQIYCDFSSYSIIALGCTRIMGIELFENFDAPYLSESIKEFWRRWHISLSSWLRDYVYIPLGGSRCSKGRKYFNILITFFVSGLWHGAAWNFILWGVLHGISQIVSEILTPLRNRINDRFHVKVNSFGFHFGKAAITFFLVNILWIFFRASNIKVALDIIGRIFSEFNPWVLFDESLYGLGLGRREVNIAVISLAVLFAADLLKKIKRVNIDTFLNEQPIWFRWSVILALLFAILTFGIYGPAFNPASFIYFQF